MGKIDLEAAKEGRRRDRRAIYRHKYVAGSAALKQFAIRVTGVFADAPWRHITCSTFLPSDRELCNLDPLTTKRATRRRRLSAKGAATTIAIAISPALTNLPSHGFAPSAESSEVLKADDRSYSPIAKC